MQLISRAMDVQAEERSSAEQSPALTINTYIKPAIFS
jgi:hypothetical protein